jgi:hypothetical protein
MVYKKYIKRGDKIFGPYYYESYRDADGKVRTRFISGPTEKDRPIEKVKLPYKSLILVFAIFTVLLLLFIGNLKHSEITGGFIYGFYYSGIADLDKKDIAEGIAKSTIISNTNVSRFVDLEVKKEEKVMKFDSPEGKITLSFDLLDYGEFFKTGKEKTMKSEDFDVHVQESAGQFKWGYTVKLEDTSFIARIDVKSQEIIEIIDDKTLKIGNNYLSFADLIRAGYYLNFNQPVVFDEFDDIDIDLTDVEIPDDITGSSIYIGGRLADIQGSSVYIDDEFVGYWGSSTYTLIEPLIQQPGGTGAYIPPSYSPPSTTPPPTPGPGQYSYYSWDSLPLINSILGFFVKGVDGFVGFVVHGFRGITGSVVQENQISVYIEKNFTGEKQAGETIDIDPSLVRIVDEEEGIEIPAKELEEEEAEACEPNWVCEKWSECEAVYNLKDLIEGRIFLKEERTQYCTDKTGCSESKFVRKGCDKVIQAIVKKVERCFKTYVEIYDEKEGILISRLEMVEGAFKKLNIQLLLTGDFCPYCYDNIKNYDEDEVDCAYTQGRNCPVCKEETSAELKPFPSILIILAILVSLCLFLIGLYLILNRGSEKREEAREVRRKPFWGRKWIKKKKVVKKKAKKEIREKSGEKGMAKDFAAFGKKVQRLKKIQSELIGLRTKGFDKEKREIKSKLKDVSALPKTEKEFRKLKGKLKHKKKKSK